jgi:hypothetical protein
VARMSCQRPACHAEGGRLSKTSAIEGQNGRCRRPAPGRPDSSKGLPADNPAKCEPVARAGLRGRAHGDRGDGCANCGQPRSSGRTPTRSVAAEPGVKGRIAPGDPSCRGQAERSHGSSVLSTRVVS